MAHYYPVVFPAGRSLAGDSLGFHAYSLRVDNCTNQWYLEESTVSYIPPYSLGMCLRLYGTGVAILLAQAPIGQPQLAPITGEQVVGVYSDQLRTEVAASPIRQFTLVQAVSDLTEGPQPALPPVGVDRLYADTSGNIHHLHSNGTDLTLVDPSNAGTLLYPSFDPHYQAMMNTSIASAALGGDLNGTIPNGHVGIQYGSQVTYQDAGHTARTILFTDSSNNLFARTPGGSFYWQNFAGSAQNLILTDSGNLTVLGQLNANSVYSTTSLQAASGYAYFGSTLNTYALGTSTQLLLRSSSGQTLIQDDGGNLSDLIAKDVQLSTGAVIAQSSAVAQLVVRPTNSNAGVMVWDGQVANSGVVIHALPGISGAQPMGFLFVSNINTGTGALYYFYGGGQLTIMVYGAGGQWSATFNNAGTNNVYWSGTDYVLQNNTASAGNYVGVFLRTA